MKKATHTVAITLFILVVIIASNHIKTLVSTQYKLKYFSDNHPKAVKNKIKSSNSDKLSLTKKILFQKIRLDREHQLVNAKLQKVQTDFYNGEGRRRSFVYFDINDTPRYYGSSNKRAAISTATNTLWDEPINLDGEGMTIGVWDEGSVRSSHGVFVTSQTDTTARVINKDTTYDIETGELIVSHHSTHVTGTLIAVGRSSSTETDGINSTNSHGMADKAVAVSYGWNGDASEMLLEAASENSLSSKLNISNHSYYILTGWDKSTTNDEVFYEWWGGENERVDSEFGKYSSYTNLGSSYHFDEIVFNNPFYLPFCASANNRIDDFQNEIIELVEPHYYLGSDKDHLNPILFNESLAPFPDGYNPNNTSFNGYDTISPPGTAKNVVTVGAIDDAVDTDGELDQKLLNLMTDFSGWGPCDDGRIKPDIVANGVNLYGPGADRDDQYGFLSGTSQACPNASGSALLIQEHFYKRSGHTLKAATLKGLIIHNAYDLGSTGPDYKFGWGLMDTLKTVQTIDLFYKSQTDNTTIKENNLIEGNLDSIKIIANSTNPIRATICWSDPAGAGLINDLDMRIIGNTTFYPWTLGGLTNPSAPATNLNVDGNSVDNVEQVIVSSPMENELFNLTVSHKSGLTNASQDYSLVISGIKTLFVTGNDNYINSGETITKVIDNTDFENVKVDQSKLNLYKIVNYSAETITIDNISFSDGTDFTTPEPLPINVGAESETELYLSFSPKSTGYHATTVTLTFSNAIVYSFDLAGTSIVVTAANEENENYNSLTSNDPSLIIGINEQGFPIYNEVTTINFTIHTGWNLLCMPFNNSKTYLSKLEEKNMTAWCWDQKMQSYIRAENCEKLSGLWVYSPNNGATVISVSDLISGRDEIKIRPGWNLNGFPKGFSIASLATEMRCYDWVAGKYRPTNFIDSTSGYWVFNPTAEECILTNE